MKKNKENENLNYILLAVGLIMGFMFIVSISIYIIKTKYALSCNCEISLPIVITILTSLGVFVGILTYYFLSKSFSKEKNKILGNIDETLNFLENEEKLIVSILIKNNGEITQNKLSKKTKINNVKIHRKLIPLISKGILKKEKNGITNKIILNNELKQLFIK
ncbi:MAG: helix-turn-helix transcriptional regulator [Nanoarchaeota archaeon]